MNITQINALRATMGLEALEVKKPKKKNNNAAIRAQENRNMKAKRNSKGK